MFPFVHFVYSTSFHIPLPLWVLGHPSFWATPNHTQICTDFHIACVDGVYVHVCVHVQEGLHALVATASDPAGWFGMAAGRHNSHASMPGSFGFFWSGHCHKWTIEWSLCLTKTLSVSAGVMMRFTRGPSLPGPLRKARGIGVCSTWRLMGAWATTSSAAKSSKPRPGSGEPRRVGRWVNKGHGAW